MSTFSPRIQRNVSVTIFLWQIPKLQKHRPAPETTYIKPQEEETLAHQREINRRKAEVRSRSRLLNEVEQFGSVARRLC